MVDTLVICIRQSHIITDNIQEYISQTYNNSNFDRLKNYKKFLSMLKGISARKLLRIFSLNHKIIANLAFSDQKIHYLLANKILLRQLKHYNFPIVQREIGNMESRIPF